MHRQGVRISEGISASVERKLRRIVALLARAEARDWVGGARDDDLSDRSRAPGDSARRGATALAPGQTPERAEPDGPLQTPAR